MRTLFATALVLGAGTASADVFTVRFDFPETANYAFELGSFGNGVTGHIIATEVVVHYTAGDAQDAADFYFTFDVPVLGSEKTHIQLLGSELGWSGSGTFDHTFVSTQYNGEIRPGRFGTEFAGGGSFTDSYIEFTVDGNRPDPIFHGDFEPFE